MKINVQSISEIEPQIEMRAPATLLINAHLTKAQMQRIFYQIWEEVGGEILKEWINADRNEDEGLIVIEIPIREDFETEAKLIMRSMYIQRGYSQFKNEGWTDDDLLKAMELMGASYRKYLIKKTA